MNREGRASTTVAAPLAGGAEAATRHWLERGFWAAADQGLFALANFVITVLLARWLTTEDFGAFTIAYSCFLLLGTIHTSLLTEPLLVFGGDRFADGFSRYLGRVLRGHWWVSAVGGLVLLGLAPVGTALQSGRLGLALLGTALAAPFILLAWLLRRACFAQFRPQLAACAGALSLIMSLVAALMLYKLHRLTVFTAPLAMGAANGASGGLLYIKLRRHGPRDGVALVRGAVLREHWRYGRWALGGSALGWVPSNVFYLILPGVAGLTGVATLRAVMNLLMPLIQALTAINALCIPAFSSGKGRMREGLRRLAGGYIVAGTAYWALLALFSKPVLSLVYGTAYVQAGSLIWLLGLLPVLTGLAGLLGAALRALERPDYVLISAALSAALAAGPGLLLSRALGIWGAAAGLLIAYAVAGATSLVLLNKAERATARVGSLSMPPGPIPAVHSPEPFGS